MNNPIFLSNQPSTSTSQKYASKLKIWNGSMAALHFILLGLATAAAINLYNRAASGVPTGLNLSLYTMQYVENVAQTEFLVVADQVVAFPPWVIMAIIGAFCLITATFHIYYAIGDNYYARVSRRQNYTRWIEYGITSTIMTFVIALLAGVKDIMTILCLVFLNITMISMGYVYESSTIPNYAIGMGFALLVAIYSIIFWSFIQRAQDARAAGFTLPVFVYLVVFLLFVLYCLFGIPQVKWRVKTPASNYKYEYLYILLSFLAKATLVVLVGLTLFTRSTTTIPS